MLDDSTARRVGDRGAACRRGTNRVAATNANRVQRNASFVLTRHRVATSASFSPAELLGHSRNVHFLLLQASAKMALPVSPIHPGLGNAPRPRRSIGSSMSVLMTPGLSATAARPVGDSCARACVNPSIAHLLAQ